MSKTKKNKKRARVNPDQAALDMVSGYLTDSRTQLAASMGNPERFADAYNSADHHLSSDALQSWVFSKSGMTDEEISYLALHGSLHGSDYVTLRGWREHPTIVRLHNATLQAVLDSDSTAEALPGSQLLPPAFAPLVALPKPVILPGSMKPSEVSALGVTSEAVTHERYDLIHIGPSRAKSFNDVRPIHSPEHLSQADFLTLTFFGRQCNADGVPAPSGRVPDLHGQIRSVSPTVSVRIGTPLTDMTHDERLDHALQQITHTAAQDLARTNVTSYNNMGELIHSTEHLLHLGLSVATYLAAAESRTDTSPPRHYTLRNKHNTPTAVSMQSIGFTTGRLIEKALATTTSPDPLTDPDPSGRRSPRPHLRKGHFKNVRYGKNRAQTRIAWIAPTLVRPEATPDPLILRDPGLQQPQHAPSPKGTTR